MSDKYYKISHYVTLATWVVLSSVILTIFFQNFFVVNLAPISLQNTFAILFVIAVALFSATKLIIFLWNKVSDSRKSVVWINIFFSLFEAISFPLILFVGLHIFAIISGVRVS
ncbi:MAG TPA: hypothetical protein P5056_03510 [Candidatus Paceibacterota bacterium]|nr:hypothetical protein [Candidatus Paceibacterota bacterium]